MNRGDNLARVIDSWLATSADEILVVDWSSTTPVAEILQSVTDSRLRIIRIDREPKWVLTHAFNLALRLSSRSRVYKIDCDIRVSPDFIARNAIVSGEFIRGFWKLAVDSGEPDQRYVNGTFGAHKSDLIRVGYYDERIQTYGWDDSDIYSRLALDLGLLAKQIDPGSARHIDQDEQQRMANQDVDKRRFLQRFEPTELEGARNKYRTVMNTTWGPYFAAQDFRIRWTSDRYGHGTRTTEPLPVDGDLAPLAATLAARQFMLWAPDALAGVPFATIGRLGFSRLIEHAHSRGVGEGLVSAIRSRCGLAFITCTDSELRASLVNTLRITAKRGGIAHGHYIMVTGGQSPSETLPLDTLDTLDTLFDLDEEVSESLAGSLFARRIESLAELESVLASEPQGHVAIELSSAMLAEDAIECAREFSETLSPDFIPSTEVSSRSVLVTSLYDEQNLLRMREYLTCLVLNVRVFERVVVLYEGRSGLFGMISHRLAAALELPPGRLVLLPFDSRPTFSELFQVQAMLPMGTTIAVSNADIAFDASFMRVHALELTDQMVVLSRRDVVKRRSASALIRLENGTPNTFSADAWIARSPFDPDFYLDYQIGTIHCDSFLNNQIGLSKRYRAINPCFDVSAFHIHDDRFNSSAEKQVRDAEHIERNYGIERQRNGGSDPVRGLGWSSVAAGLQLDHGANLQLWRPKALVVDMGDSSVHLIHLLLVHLFTSILSDSDDIVVVARISKATAGSDVQILLARYQRYFAPRNFQLDVSDRPLSYEQISEQRAFVRRSTPDDLIAWTTTSDRSELKQKLVDFAQWPGIEGTKMIRAEVMVDLDTLGEQHVVADLCSSQREIVDELTAFAQAGPEWSLEHKLLSPFIVDSRIAASRAQPAQYAATPSVSFVTSLFQGGDFLPAFLENTLAAAAISGGEMVIVDANVDGQDAMRVRKFIKDNASSGVRIEFIELDEDPGLYECWRIGIENSRAPLISNANVDDRRSPSHTRRLVEALERSPRSAAACGVISCVREKPLLPWHALMDSEFWFRDFPKEEFGFDDLYVVGDDGLIRSHNLLHCMPVWRRSLHDKYGYFDERTYGTSADWAFWLHCAKSGETFLFEREAIGRYYLNVESHNRRNDKSGRKELRIIEDYIGVQQARIDKR